MDDQEVTVPLNGVGALRSSMAQQPEKDDQGDLEASNVGVDSIERNFPQEHLSEQDETPQNEHVENETTSRKPGVLNFKLDSEEILSLPPGERIKTDIAFGDNGTIAHINEYGELLVIKKYVDLGESGMVTATSHVTRFDFQVELEKRLDSPSQGIGLCLSEHYAGQIEKLRVEFVHDRWPKISYNISSLASVEIYFAVQNGRILQEYLITNLSDEAEVVMLFNARLNIALWPESFWAQPYGAYDVLGSMELELGPDDLSAHLKGEPRPSYDEIPEIGALRLNFAMFEDGKAVGLSSSPKLSLHDLNWDMDAVEQARTHVHRIALAKGQVRELTAIYHLEALNSKIKEEELNIQVPDYVRTFLLNDKHGIWGKVPGPEDFMFVFRRYLEHILSVCAIPVRWDESKTATAISLSDGEMIEPASDGNWQFQYLLMMHEFLEGPVAEPGLKQHMQRRIKNVCKGFIEWCYDIAEEPKTGGWHCWYNQSGKPFALSRDEIYFGPGAYYVLLLCEFFRIFPEEHEFVLRKIEAGRIVRWLETLGKRRHPKSKLWVTKVTDQLIEWYDPRCRENEEIKIPHFRLSELVVLWRALQFLQKISEPREPKDNTANLQAQGQSQNGGNEKLAGGIPPDADSLHHADVTSSSLKRDGSIRSVTGNPDMKDPATDVADTKGSMSKDVEVKDPETKAREIKDPFEVIQKRMHDDPHGGVRKEINELIQALAPAGLRSRIFECFTFSPQDLAANLGTRAARLGVCLSANSAEPRSHFHSSDAVLFDALEWGFFDDEFTGGRKAVWTETVRAQDETDKDWDVPLRYAQALRKIDQDRQETKDNTFAKKEKPIAIQGPPTAQNQEKRRRKNQQFRQILLRSVLSSGLFAHKLNMSKQQIRIMYPPSPWNRFEVPYLLLRIDFAKLFLTRQDQRIRVRNIREPLAMGSTDPEEALKEVRKVRKSRDGRKGNISLVGRRRLVEYAEPEWLYNDLSFFREHDAAEIDDEAQNLQLSDSSLSGALKHSLGMFKELSSYDTVRALIIDVPRNTNLKNEERAPNSENECSDTVALDNYLRGERTRNKAKKRFIMLDSGTHESIVVLCIRCPSSERSSMAGFLNRHSEFKNFASEMTSRAANLWMTEFHLTFYKLLSHNSSDIDQHGSDKFVTCRVESTLEAPQFSKILVKATRSFRIVGDMYDRSWTCWTLSRVPGIKGDSSSGDDDSLMGAPLRGNKSLRKADSSQADDFSWKGWLAWTKDGFHAQRRVLELRLFEKMAKEAYGSTEEILERVNSLLHNKPEPSESGTDLAFIKLSKATFAFYDRITVILSDLEKNAEEIRDTIKDWEEREAVEALEKPRWSESDEVKHGKTLSAELRKAKRIIEKLKEQEKKIQNKIDQVDKLSSTARSDLDLSIAEVQARTGEDVRLFTYATVIFLPLSFSSSLFSMGGSPSHPTIKSFAETVIITLLITFLLLLNIKLLAKEWESIKKATISSAHSKMARSGHEFWKHKAHALQEERRRETGDPQTSPPQSYSGSTLPSNSDPPSKFWYLWFLISYVVLILPATCVALALEVLLPTERKGKDKEVLIPKKAPSVRSQDGSINDQRAFVPENKTNETPQKQPENISEGASKDQEVTNNNQEGSLEDQENREKNKKTSHKDKKPRFLSHALSLLIGLLMLPFFAAVHIVLLVLWNGKDIFSYLFSRLSSPEAKMDEDELESTTGPDANNDKGAKQSNADIKHPRLVTTLSSPLRLQTIWKHKSGHPTEPNAAPNADTNMELNAPPYDNTHSQSSGSLSAARSSSPHTKVPQDIEIITPRPRQEVDESNDSEIAPVPPEMGSRSTSKNDNPSTTPQGEKDKKAAVAAERMPARLWASFGNVFRKDSRHEKSEPGNVV